MENWDLDNNTAYEGRCPHGGVGQIRSIMRWSDYIKTIVVILASFWGSGGAGTKGAEVDRDPGVGFVAVYGYVEGDEFEEGADLGMVFGSDQLVDGVTVTDELILGEVGGGFGGL